MWFFGASLYDFLDNIQYCSHQRYIKLLVCCRRHLFQSKVQDWVHSKRSYQQRGCARLSKCLRGWFQLCAWAILDGILIWIHKPSRKDCMDAGCDSGKFMCCQRKMFGRYCQAVCDIRSCILDISIIHLGSTLDCLAFKWMLALLAMRLGGGTSCSWLMYFWRQTTLLFECTVHDHSVHWWHVWWDKRLKRLL
jgi:hypothetical protein